MKTPIHYFLGILFFSSCSFICCTAQSTLFYGTTTDGGGAPNPKGIIFSFDKTTGKDSVIWRFGRGKDGSYPEGSFVPYAPYGLLYCTTTFGGTTDSGTIISFNPMTNAEKVVWNFETASDGKCPGSNLVFCPLNGLFYITTFFGGVYNKGAIISFNPATNTEKVAWSFGAANDGAVPGGDLLFDDSTRLFYGTTSANGAYNLGTVISFDPASDSEKVVADLGWWSSDASIPQCGLVYNPLDSLYYGISKDGGNYSAGTIFSFNRISYEENVVWSFGTSTNDGQQPIGPLTFDPVSKLFYGMTHSGGYYFKGAIFSFNPATKQEKVLWSFGNLPDGQFPFGKLLSDTTNRLLYGLTSGGGAEDLGTIFSLNPATNTEKIEWSFKGGTDGQAPLGNLISYQMPRTSPCHAGFTLFADSSQRGLYNGYNQSAGNNLHYLWNFGDGDTSASPFPTHYYSDSGFYNICLFVTGDSNCISIYCDSMYFIARTEGSSMHEIRILENIPTATLKSSVAGDIQIMPNPCSSCMLKGVDNINDICISDMLGRMVNGFLSKTPGGYYINIIGSPGEIYFVKDLKTGRVVKFVKE